MLFRDISDSKNSLSISTNVPESLLLYSSSPAHFACWGAAVPCFTSGHIATYWRWTEPLQLGATQSRHFLTNWGWKIPLVTARYCPPSSLLTQAVLPFTSEEQGLTWGLPHGIRHYLPESLQTVGVHHIYTLAEPINQMRGRTDLGYSCSSLQLNFCGIKYVLSVVLTCSPQSKWTKSWLFLLSATFQISWHQRML